jgi:hypothetical protein
MDEVRKRALPYSENKIYFLFYRNAGNWEAVLPGNQFHRNPETCFHRKLTNQLTRNTVLQDPRKL